MILHVTLQLQRSVNDFAHSSFAAQVLHTAFLSLRITFWITFAIESVDNAIISLTINFNWLDDIHDVNFWNIICANVCSLYEKPDVYLCISQRILASWVSLSFTPFQTLSKSFEYMMNGQKCSNSLIYLQIKRRNGNRYIQLLSAQREWMRN